MDPVQDRVTTYRRNAVTLLWLAMALHLVSSVLAALGLLGPGPPEHWYLVDSLSIVLLLLLVSLLATAARWMRWVLLATVLASTPIVYPQLLGAGNPLILWVALFQLCFQLLACAFAVNRTPRT